jgi:hypothetical protein
MDSLRAGITPVNSPYRCIHDGEVAMTINSQARLACFWPLASARPLLASAIWCGNGIGASSTDGSSDGFCDLILSITQGPSISIAALPSQKAWREGMRPSPDGIAPAWRRSFIMRTARFTSGLVAVGTPFSFVMPPPSPVTQRARP